MARFIVALSLIAAAFVAALQSCEATNPCVRWPAVALDSARDAGKEV